MINSAHELIWDTESPLEGVIFELRYRETSN